MNCMIFFAFRGGVLTVSRLTAGIQSCKSKANKLNFIQCSLFAGATYVKPSSPKDLDLVGSCKWAQQSRRDSEELSMDGLDPEIKKTGS